MTWGLEGEGKFVWKSYLNLESNDKSKKSKAAEVPQILRCSVYSSVEWVWNHQSQGHLKEDHIYKSAWNEGPWWTLSSQTPICVLGTSEAKKESESICNFFFKYCVILNFTLLRNLNNNNNKHNNSSITLLGKKHKGTVTNRAFFWNKEGYRYENYAALLLLYSFCYRLVKTTSQTICELQVSIGELKNGPSGQLSATA